MSKKKKVASIINVVTLGFLGGYNLVANAYSVPGWTEPYNLAAYYSLTEISWEDSPSPFALKDLARNGGTVYDMTRHIKSIVAGDNLEQTAEILVSKTASEDKNSKPFSEEIFLETAKALKNIGKITDEVAKTADISETNSYLRQGNADDWETYDNNFYKPEEKYKWLDNTYKNFVEGARQNALIANMAQLQAVKQAAEYDETVESAYIDLITKFDVADPYDEVTYKMIGEEYGYEKEKPKGMPDFK